MLPRSFARTAKRALFGSGRRPRSVWLGPLAGAKFVTDPMHDSHRIVGVYEREISAHFRRLARLAGGVVDVGTNDGYYAIAAAVLNPQAKVVGYEGNAAHEPIFRENLAANGLAADRVQFVASFVGSSFVTLDAAAKDLPKPLLIKIDVEGAEADVLKSGPLALAEPKTMVIIETHSLDLERECVAILQGHGFRTQIITPGWYRAIIREVRPLAHNQWLIAEKP